MTSWPDTLHLLADVHLADDTSPAAQQLAGYLAGPARGAAAVYILGDLFDVWVGDDVSFDTHRATLDALAGLAAARVPLYFQRGNRDFAVGARFFTHTGARPIADPVVHRLAGQPVLLAHGDVFCSDDVAHQRFRARYTSAVWRSRMLRVPAGLRRVLARRARQRSAAAKMRKDAAIMDVQADTVARWARETETFRIIHGHTHRPGDHTHGRVKRHVLADWRPDRAEILTLSRRAIQRRLLDAEGRFVDTSGLENASGELSANERE